MEQNVFNGFKGIDNDSIKSFIWTTLMVYYLNNRGTVIAGYNNNKWFHDIK